MDAFDLLGMANHPALELLNSTSDATGVHLDVLADGDGLLAWLGATALLPAEEAARVRSSFSRADLDAAAAGARGFRERMRGEVTAWSGLRETLGGTLEETLGGTLSWLAVQEINALLAQDRRHLVLTGEPKALRVVDAHSWVSAHALLALPAAAFADLATTGDPTLTRRCEGLGCTLWFYDRTKSHRRRWCSMAICGNRAKARAHRARVAQHR